MLPFRPASDRKIAGSKSGSRQTLGSGDATVAGTVLGGGCSMSSMKDRDRCPNCLRDYDIVALKFHLFRPASALMVCMSCGMVQSELDDGEYARSVPRLASERPLEIGTLA